MTDIQPTAHEHMPPKAAPQLLPPTARLGAVHLDVTDGMTSTMFWTHYIGLTLIEETDDQIALGIGDEVLIVLHPGATSPVIPRHTGLYHVAIHVPSRKELARIVARLFAIRWQNSPTDHTESIATYLSDPDGNGIEITFETPERGHLVRSETTFGAMLADGTMRGATEALDVNDLFAELTKKDDLRLPMPTGTRIGHVHLHVADLQATRSFITDVLGFGDMRSFERMGMSDFSLNTSFVPHALAINIWHGKDAQPRPAGSAGLRSWNLILPDTASLDALAERLTAAKVAFERKDSVVSTMDPAGNVVQVRVTG